MLYEIFTIGRVTYTVPMIGFFFFVFVGFVVVLVVVFIIFYGTFVCEGGRGSL